MRWEDILTQFNSLPPEGQKQILDFIAILQAHYLGSHSAERKESLKIEEEGFIGMWQDREDMQDSTAWVRSLRENE